MHLKRENSAPAFLFQKKRIICNMFGLSAWVFITIPTRRYNIYIYIYIAKLFINDNYFLCFKVYLSLNFKLPLSLYAQTQFTVTPIS